MRILLTNDDGIDGPGLHALARALNTCGHEVVIAAPNRDYSGYGAALGPLHVTGQVLFEDRAVEGLLGVEAYAVDGPPALCAFSAALGGFGGNFDLLVSGINAGANLGRAVLHSGTVGAALTASQFGVPAMAVSLAHRGDEAFHWDTAAMCAASLVHAVCEIGTDAVLNVNVPNRRPYAVRGMKAAKLALRGVIQATMAEAGPGTLEISYGRSDPVPGSDIALLLDGWITLSLIEAARDVGGTSVDAVVARLTNEELAG
ncbi:MAG: 5/3-nucleotidase [Actinomycetota bacterium]